jgi:hypothetical protein
MTTDVDSPIGSSPTLPGQKTVAPADRTEEIPAAARKAPPSGRDAVAAPPAEEPQEIYFRFPAADDPDPGWPRLLGMSAYASMLGLAGVGVGLDGMLSTISGGVPGWYVPVLALAGMLSVILSVGAFLSIHRRNLPWVLLLAAAVPLSAAVLLAIAY